MKTLNKNKKISSAIEESKGFYLGLKLLDEELIILKTHIKRFLYNRIDKYATTKKSRALLDKDIELERYHEIPHMIDHSFLFMFEDLINRDLPTGAGTDICRFQFFQVLEEEFGKFKVLDKYDVKREEFHPRLVRPGEKSDVGSMHAEKWYWDKEIAPIRVPPGYKRVRVWIAVCCEPGLSGLRYIEGSHLREWHYTYERRDGLIKPRFDESQVKQPIKLFYTSPGDVIVFHDRLVHGGAISRGKNTRVSVEFTIHVKDDT